MRKLFVRLGSRRANGKDFSLELTIYIPKSILITYRHLIFQIYTMLPNYDTQVLFLTPKSSFDGRRAIFVAMVKRHLTAENVVCVTRVAMASQETLGS